MRVFCPEHKRSFFAPRQSPIKCENHGHVLGELNFRGERDSSFDFRWQYCCNCEHFSPIDVAEHGLERCPVCTRRTSRLFLCDRCYTISFESNTPLETKNFTITAEGAARPCCPGCLNPASADLREHTCEEAGASFVTGLISCPICDERLDIGPSFPSSVAHYLRRTKAANKVYATFDYDTELFVPIEDGEFVLIKDNDESGKTFVLPRSPRLNAARDFYELYQDYYHCAIPESGEININEPAVVVQTNEGWNFQSRGTMAIVNNEPKKIPTVITPPKNPVIRETSPRPTVITPPKVEPIVRETSVRPKVETEEAATPCAQCNTMVEAKYSFCWKCGHPRATKEQASGFRPERSRLIVSALDDDLEPPSPQQQKRSILSSAVWNPAVTSPSKAGFNRSVLKLFGILVIGFLVGAVIAFSRMSSSSASTNQVTTSKVETTPKVETPPVAAATAEPAPSVEMKQASLEAAALSAEDAALERLRQMRDTAVQSDQAKILKTISETEKKYRADYRFPYERAKVVVKSRTRSSHQQAFSALARAAQRAINSGKSREMLQNLNDDSQGDFQKLAHGHREWTQLQKALKTKDVTVLDVEEAF